MANVDPRVMTAVEAAIKKNPGATVDELFALAQSVNPETGGLTKRQFHARYPLQVKRKMSRRRRRKRGPANKGRTSRNGTARDAVRTTFLKFASELAAAEDRGDVVRVVASVDQYVDEVLAATK